MKLTKYQHACFTVEDDGKLLVVDPGTFSTDFLPPEHTVAVVITHEHADHFDHDQIAAIVDKNPDVVILAHESITSQIVTGAVQSVKEGDMVTVGPFNLELFGGKHAVIHPKTPIVANLGVMINELLYYPGDSFVLPGKAVDTLALPASAPWMKISEAMDYLSVIKPRLAFPTHDAILSDAGKSIADAWLAKAASDSNAEYNRLEGPIEL